MAVVLFLLSLLFIRTYTWENKKQNLLRRDWWGHPIAGSGAWTLSDSWATNISTGLVVIGTILSTESAVTTNSLFPGIALDRFAVVFIVAGAIVAAAPVAFGTCYSVFTARNPGPAADSTVLLSPPQAVTVRAPSGASITMTADADVRDGVARHKATVRAGCAYQIPAGTEIVIERNAGDRAPAISFSGTSDIGTIPGTTVRLNADALAWTIQKGDLVAPGEGQGDVLVTFPARIIANGGTKITVTGTADIKLPKDAV
ncbi:MAG TPA: hypothetical protein VKG80_08195, partial [Trebonia sp.]|nr:hypothetical protein [Trebonia sp.]